MSLYFPSKYPIVQALMNQVCDVRLGAAVDEAGAFPSLWISKSQKTSIALDQTNETIKEFKALTGHSRVLVGVTLAEIKDFKLIDLLHSHGIKYIEIWGLVSDDGQWLDFNSVYSDPNNKSWLTELRKKFKLSCRINQPVISQGLDLFDAICLKGAESAGLSGAWAVKDLFFEQRKKSPLKNLIPYGGVGNSSQVLDYLSNGAASVGVGTLFAMSQESPLSIEVKEKMIQKTSNDITKAHSTGQNLISLNKRDGLESIADGDWNRTSLLNKGIFGKGDQGLVYVGHAIDQVTEIKTVKQIVDQLVDQINDKKYLQTSNYK
jgi:NAD(P)H-dependent flavin oxidoreductase YrpB (nitropropane dioxygenase family)